MRYCNPNKREQTRNKIFAEKEISKGMLGLVVKRPKETIFTFYKSIIDKRKKLKEELDSLLKSYKLYKPPEGILKIKSLNASSNSFIITTEPIIDCLSNLHSTKFKGFQIFKIFQKFNLFIKYCFDNNINLSNIELSDIYLTVDNELKLLSVNYDLEILHKIKKEKYTINQKQHKNNIQYIIGTILYYLYYNEYPKISETKFPEPKYFKELIKYCLFSNHSKKLDFNEYINQSFFHPYVNFPNCNKSGIIPFNSYKSTEVKKDVTIPDCDDLYYTSKKIQISEYRDDYIHSIYDMNKNKILEEKSYYGPIISKLNHNKNKNLYLVIFEKKICIIKKYSPDKYSLIQEINLENIENVLELSTGELILMSRHVYLFSRISEDKFQEKLKISEIRPHYVFETEDNYLCISGKEKTILYDIKTNMKKVKESKGKKIYINEKISINLETIRGSSIFNEFFEEDIFIFDERILCVIKKKDGTYLVGGYENNIYQLYFDKYGFVELISKVDTGYGYYEDNLEGDCIYSIPDSRYYSVGYIKECENGDIITISDYAKRKKLWKL